MRILMLAALVLFSQTLWAGCVSENMKGGHTALTEAAAKQGAWEEARDACYPGDAQRAKLVCTDVEGKIGVQGKPAVRCFQEVTCTLCGEALKRRSDAQWR